MDLVLRSTDTPGMLMFFCPGCRCGHGVWTDPAHPNEFTGAVWSFDGNTVAPTFSPSILIYGAKGGPRADGQGNYRDTPRCHSFVRAGKIQFLDDCEHALRGQTVPLEPF